MSDDSLSRSVEAALLPMVASLAPWGVDDAHWLPDRDGSPVIWVRTATRAQQAALQQQIWLAPQIQVTLTRLGVPHDVVWQVRIEVTSVEAEGALFGE